MADIGDQVFDMAAANLIPSGPGGVTRDRAVDLVRSGMSLDQAVARAQSETAAGHNPRDPHQVGATPTSTSRSGNPTHGSSGGSSPLTKTVSIGHMNIPVWALGIAALDLLLVVRR